MKYLVIFLLFVSVFSISCSKSCKDVNGDFSNYITSLNYTSLTIYKFSGSNVKLMSTSKTGNQDYKPGLSQKGSFKVDGDKVIMNFGGSDVILNISRDYDGCIKLLSNDLGTYERR